VRHRAARARRRRGGVVEGRLLHRGRGSRGVGRRAVGDRPLPPRLPRLEGRRPWRVRRLRAARRLRRSDVDPHGV
ncbi:MAG: hypothetical protein AVDCRST_MAG53-3241, partial [uncultured Solirubrobacteraceae bacterium]